MKLLDLKYLRKGSLLVAVLLCSVQSVKTMESLPLELVFSILAASGRDHETVCAFLYQYRMLSQVCTLWNTIIIQQSLIETEINRLNADQKAYWLGRSVRAESRRVISLFLCCNANMHELMQWIDKHNSVHMHSAWRCAIDTRKTDIVSLLLTHGADINKQHQYLEDTALMRAAELNDVSMVKFLFTSGADHSVRSRCPKTIGKTAYELTNNEEIKQLFHERMNPGRQGRVRRGKLV